MYSIYYVDSMGVLRMCHVPNVFPVANTSGFIPIMSISKIAGLLRKWFTVPTTKRQATKIISGLVVIHKILSHILVTVHQQLVAPLIRSMSITSSIHLLCVISSSVNTVIVPIDAHRANKARLHKKMCVEQHRCGTKICIINLVILLC